MGARTAKAAPCRQTSPTSWQVATRTVRRTAASFERIDLVGGSEEFCPHTSKAGATVPAGSIFAAPLRHKDDGAQLHAIGICSVCTFARCLRFSEACSFCAASMHTAHWWPGLLKHRYSAVYP